MSNPFLLGGADELRMVDEVALRRGDPSPTGTPQDCRYPLHALEVIVADALDRPEYDVAVELRDNAGRALRTRTRRDGIARFEGLASERYSLSLCELEHDAWAYLTFVPLEPRHANVARNLHWARLAPPAHEAGFTHTVVQGECLAELAARFGRLPDAVWRHPSNALLAARQPSMHILAPGNRIVFPKRETKDMVVQVNRSYRLLRKAVQANLNVRFLDGYGRPHADVRYLLEIKGPRVARQHGSHGTLDSAGFMRAYILPSVGNVLVTLDGQFGRESYEIEVGALDPIDTEEGVVARLNNLGLDCIVNEPASLAAAVAAFQRLVGRPVTGQLDDDTRTALLAEHLC